MKAGDQSLSSSAYATGRRKSDTTSLPNRNKRNRCIFEICEFQQLSTSTQSVQNLKLIKTYEGNMQYVDLSGGNQFLLEEYGDLEFSDANDMISEAADE